MSLLSTFLASHLIPALEAALASHEPEIQAALLAEVEDLAASVGAWVKSKLESTAKEG